MNRPIPAILSAGALALFIVISITGAPLAAQSPAAASEPRPSPAGRALYDSAYVAWDMGDYPNALSRFERLLAGNDGERFRESIALLTGELFRTVHVAPDGANLRWSRDGRFAWFTTDSARVTQVVALEGDSMRQVARIDGVGLVFSPSGGAVAYFAVSETPELRAARALTDSLVRAGAGTAQVAPRRARVTRLERELARVVLRDLQSGQERELQVPELAKTGLAFSSDGRSLYFVGSTRTDSATSNIYVIDDIASAASVRALTDGPGVKQNPMPARAGDLLVYAIDTASVVVRNIASGETWTFAGRAPAVSTDGMLVTWLTRARNEYTVSALSLREWPGQPIVVKRSARPLATPAASPDGQRIAFAMQLFDDWEIYVVGANGQNETRITREIQHDRFPRWVDAEHVLAVKGEPRHSRSFVYEVGTGNVTRLHHNNSVRTVAPEYDWAPSPDGTKVLIVADRDGDTISPERAVVLVNLRAQVPIAELVARVRSSLAAERDLRDRGRRMFALVEAVVRPAVRDVSVARIYGYERALYEFDSKHITQPGNRKAIDYIANTLRSFGYEPELQWFETRQGVRTANIVATLRGTTNPDLVYVVSSHFDSVQGGPGADDDSSGSAALLDVARVMARRPQAATIQFAWFTGEEAGLLGSREFVRRAVENKLAVVGALNNDMVGWANDHRLDNTIRYSNAGIRDLQHAAALQFTDLITYDARYYRGTDAVSYYERYGDIVGGIGSYPILGNPHYHQPDDILETINHQLVAEVSKTTVASIMLLASSPSRLKGLEVSVVNGTAQARWTPAAETGVSRYVVTYGPPGDPTARTATVVVPRTTLPGAQPGWVVAVKAVNPRGIQSWDWARATVP